MNAVERQSVKLIASTRVCVVAGEVQSQEAEGNGVFGPWRGQAMRLIRYVMLTMRTTPIATLKVFLKVALHPCVDTGYKTGWIGKEGANADASDRSRYAHRPTHF